MNTLLSYITGHRKGKEAHRIEAEAMRDPFLSESMEGYDSVKGEHAASIRQLQTEIRKKSRKRSFPVMKWGAVACLLIVTGLGGYYLIKNESEDTIASTTKLPAGEQHELSESVKKAEDAFVSGKNEPAGLPEKAEDFSGDTLSSAKTASEPGSKKMTATTRTTTNSPIRIVNIRSFEDSVKADSVKPSVSEDTTDTKKIKVPEEKLLAEISKQNDSANAVEVVIVGKGNGRKLPFTGAISSSKGKKIKQPDTIIKGKVVDESGKPLIGALISIKDKGIVSDIDGNFSIETAPYPQQAIVSYIGFKPDTLTLSADAKDELLVKMKPDETSLSEFVVVGSGKAKKVTVVGSTLLDAPEPLIGEKAYRSYLKKNRIRPLDKNGKRVKGRVVVEFRVGAGGRPEDLTIKKSLDDAADREALRLIQEGPGWKAGAGKASVTVKF